MFVFVRKCIVTAFNPTLTGADPSLRGGTTGTEEAAIVAGPYSFTVEVKYARREIRSLSDQDREMFFNAVAVLQRVPSSVGQALYGSNYYSKDYMTRLHLYYGEWNEREMFCLDDDDDDATKKKQGK